MQYEQGFDGKGITRWAFSPRSARYGVVRGVSVSGLHIDMGRLCANALQGHTELKLFCELLRVPYGSARQYAFNSLIKLIHVAADDGFLVSEASAKQPSIETAVTSATRLAMHAIERVKKPGTRYACRRSFLSCVLPPIVRGVR